MTTRRGERIGKCLDSYHAQSNTRGLACPACGERPPVSIETILWPLAEATVECPTGEHPGVEHEGLDPRFETLRRPPPMGYWQPPAAYWGGVNASLEAIVRAAAACDLVVTWLSVGGPHGVSLAEVQQRPLPAVLSRKWVGDGATPEEALARALVAAWRDGKAASSTEPREH